MMNAYSNLCGPPRSSVHVVTRPVGKQVVFSMQYAGLDSSRLEANLTMQDKARFAQEWITNFERKYKAALDAVSRPMGFMVGRAYTGDDEAIVCKDPILTIAILGRVSRMLYIPRRELGWCACLEGTSICFPANYFSQCEGVL